MTKASLYDDTKYTFERADAKDARLKLGWLAVIALASLMLLSMLSTESWLAALPQLFPTVAGQRMLLLALAFIGAGAIIVGIQKLRAARERNAFRRDFLASLCQS